MYCKNCGKRIDDTSKYCPECGASQERRESTSNNYYNNQNRAFNPLGLIFGGILFNSLFGHHHCHHHMMGHMFHHHHHHHF